MADMPDFIYVSKSAVEELIKNANHQSDWVIGMFAMIVPDWDNVDYLDGYIQCNKNTWLEIMDMAVAYDKQHHPEVMAGGLWLNYGFSADDDSDLADWMVRLPRVVYKEK